MWDPTHFSRARRSGTDSPECPLHKLKEGDARTDTRVLPLVVHQKSSPEQNYSGLGRISPECPLHKLRKRVTD